MKNKTSAKAVLALAVIAVVCVALLTVLNDLLYVPPDMGDFQKAYEAEYEAVPVKDVGLSAGKITLAAEGTDGEGTKVVGLYVESAGYGKASSFTVIIVIEKESGVIKGSYLKTQGSTGSAYNYDPALLGKLNGTNIKEFSQSPDLIVTGATNSSYAVLSAFTAAKEYFTGGVETEIYLGEYKLAYQAEYSGLKIEEQVFSDGKVIMAASGVDGGGAEMTALTVESNGYGRTSAFTVLIVIENGTGLIKGAYIKVQGSTGPRYDYSQEALSAVYGADIRLIEAGQPDLLVTGATHSSTSAINAFLTAKEYFLSQAD